MQSALNTIYPEIEVFDLDTDWGHEFIHNQGWNMGLVFKDGVFAGNANQSRLFVDPYTLGGEGRQFTFTTIQEWDPNALFFDLIPADWFRVLHSAPQMTMYHCLSP